MRLEVHTLGFLMATLFLGLTVLVPWTDPALKNVAIGALAGLVAGHVNGRRSARSAQDGP